MIIHYAYGQLGNQLFQYSFLKTVARPKETIVTSNFESLMKLIDLPDNRIIFIKHAIFKYAVPILKALALARIVSSYRVNTNTRDGVFFELDTFTCRKGLLPVQVIFPGYFQSESFFNPEKIKDMAIKDSHIEEARKLTGNISGEHNKIFVHVRRGDYLTCDFHGLGDVTLPVSYYLKQVDWFKKNVSNPFFVFLTNDASYVDANFSDVGPKIISNGSLYVDLAIMTLCDGAILSNSSFSWWGAYFMQKRTKVFAPRYWLGFKKKIEIPTGIFPAFAEAVDVD
jgi:hypothetical protein